MGEKHFKKWEQQGTVVGIWLDMLKNNKDAFVEFQGVDFLGRAPARVQK